MNFIGRQQELELLEREYQKQGSFVVINGRRRIGKTTLIREFIKNKRAFYFLATEEIEAQGKKRLADVVARTTGNSMLQRVSFSDWLDLFRLIAEDQPGEKKVLVIDEFPYLVKANPAFPSILQKAWDEILKDANVMLILCGSLISMMQKYALAYDSPLYGRRTAQIRLGQLSFPEVYKARKLSFSDAVEQYAVTGGVPKYLEMFNDQEPLLSQLESVALSKNGFLYEEPNFLLKDEVMSSVSYFSILRIIAEGNHRLSKIAGALETGTSALTPYLSTLSELGFISRETPVTEKKPEKSRRGLYFISDNFMRFWFRYVYPFKGELELDNLQPVLEEIQKDFVQRFTAHVYEEVCREIVMILCREKKLPIVPSKIGSFWSNDSTASTEIDVMAVDHQNRRVFAGECKYRSTPLDLPVFYDLRDKVRTSEELQKTFMGYEIIYGLFSKSGFTGRLLEESRQNPQLFLIFEDKVMV